MSAPALALEHLFEVTLGDLELGSFTSCTGLTFEYQTYEYGEGGNNLFVHRQRGRIRHENLVLAGGMTNQDTLLQWVLSGERWNVLVRFAAPDGRLVRDFRFQGAVPVRWTGPNATAAANAVASETLEIAHQGMTR